jgi:hypothetical protein
MIHRKDKISKMRLSPVFSKVSSLPVIPAVSLSFCAQSQNPRGVCVLALGCDNQGKHTNPPATESFG